MKRPRNDFKNILVMQRISVHSAKAKCNFPEFSTKPLHLSRLNVSRYSSRRSTLSIRFNGSPRKERRKKENEETASHRGPFTKSNRTLSLAIEQKLRLTRPFPIRRRRSSNISQLEPPPNRQQSRYVARTSG